MDKMDVMDGASLGDSSLFQPVTPAPFHPVTPSFHKITAKPFNLWNLFHLLAWYGLGEPELESYNSRGMGSPGVPENEVRPGDKGRVTEASQPALMSTLSDIQRFPFGTAVSAVVVREEPEAAPAPVLDPTSDHALLEATKHGDESAFALLVARYRNQITNYVYRMTNDYDGAVDLAQETFVRVYQAADRYQTTYAFSTYIYRIATNLAISELRKRKRRRMVSLTGFFQGRDGQEPQEFNPPDERPLQDESLVDTERRDAVARAIGTLPDKYRAPLILRDVEGKSYEEISRIMEMSEGTVKSRISRARGLLREKLRAYF